MKTNLILIACIAVVGTGYYAYSAKQKSFAEQAQLKRDRAVSVLSPDTQESWLAYVDQKISGSIQSRAGGLALLNTLDESTPDPYDETTLVSRNTPYKVTCSPVAGGSIVFGYGDDATTVRIYDLNSPAAHNQPALEVATSSIAAAKLSKILCERVSISMSKIILHN